MRTVHSTCKEEEMEMFDQRYSLTSGNSKVDYAIRGVRFGSHRWLSPGAPERIADMAKEMGVSRVIRPQLKFTNVVTTDEHPLEKQTEIDGVEIFTTPEPCDGVLVSKKGTGVFIANADCPVLILYAAEAMVVCHVGLECLLHEVTIIDSAFAALGAFFHNPLKASVLGCLAFGAGPCCYGLSAAYDVHDRIARRFNHPDISVVTGPRAGTRAINIADLCLQNCKNSPCKAFQGAPHNFRAMHAIETCTSCAGFVDPNVHGFGSYFSNVRDDKEKPTNARNGVLVTLT